ncbi:MAG: bis(5'-nucleosyl)-tetraphosphatase (symmetrical) YqeK [Clostridia bacterium]|nr:bis(5'-nucleosyl)-tetraphosphatase (symmetrical) YqeK [Clostridia bacterium]
MSQKRFNHTLGVEKCAKWLGTVLLPDLTEELSAAALLHDIAKEIPKEEQLSLMKSLDFCFTEEDFATPLAFHSFAGAALIKRDFPEYATENILSAVFYHTLGSPDMSLFDRIIFISDFIEENRTYPTCRETREFLVNALKEAETYSEKITALNKAVYLSCKCVLQNLNRQNLPVNSRTVMTKIAFER